MDVDVGDVVGLSCSGVLLEILALLVVLSLSALLLYCLAVLWLYSI